MHLVKCENGHIYDAYKFRSCPNCSKVSFGADADILGLHQEDVETEIPEEEQQQAYACVDFKKAVGLLICTEGQMKGEGFILREGENELGRASNMDIALTKEESVSRKSHVIIWYDMEQNVFSLEVPEGKKPVYKNGKIIKKKCKIKDKDELQIGNCRLRFIEAGSIWHE